MNQKSKLHKYLVKLGLFNINEASDPNIEQDLTEEIMMRPHLELKSIHHDHLNHRVVVELALLGLNKEVTARQMAEELFEIGSAILRHIDGVRIIVLDTLMFEEIDEA